jgi:predicted fused transcriptional regulator/phosphomethylpyrimidine kinase
MLGESGDRWLLRLHMQLARDLNGAGWSQNQIARILGSTQSTVSRQLSRTLPDLASADADTVDAWSADLSKHLIVFGPNTKVLRQRIIMELQFDGGQTFQSNRTLTGIELEGSAVMASLLRQLEWSCSRLSAERMSNWASAVGMNLAACLPEAESSEEVAAFPGRLSILGGRIRHHEKASLGASSSLSKILLQAKKLDANKCSIINIKAPLKSKHVDETRITKCCKKMGWKISNSEKGKISSMENEIDVIIEKGEIGWEPHIFILGENSGEVVTRTHAFIDAFDGAAV